MSQSPFLAAIEQIAEEKGLTKEAVLETVEAAIAAAYRKEYGNPHQNLRAEIGESTDDAKIYQVFTVVPKEEFEDENHQKLLAEAKKIRKNAKVGETVEIELEYHKDFGRIAAQTAKQVVIQRLREAERQMLYEEFKTKENQVVNGVVQQVEGDTVTLNLGKINAIMPPPERIPSERHFTGQRLKVFVTSVEETGRGPRIVVSRAHPNLVAGLFMLEVPEIAAGTVVVKAIAREAGSRTKMAVQALQMGLDPVGSCVGQRGTRVQAVLSELSEEKIDIVLWDDDIKKFITNALSPAKVDKIELDLKERRARVHVGEDQLSLAIGKGGQNVRLASKMTGWGLDIVREGGEDTRGGKDEKDKVEAKPEKVKEVSSEPEETTPKPVESAAQEQPLDETPPPPIAEVPETPEESVEIAQEPPKEE